MGSVKLHALVLSGLLFLLGLGTIAYQIWVLEVPLNQDETDPVWVVDAQVSFTAREDAPVKARMFVPPLESGYTTLNESFISHNYGVNITREEGNRVVTWSARRAQGPENLYYRLMVTPRFAEPKRDAPGPEFRTAPRLEGAERLAVEALLEQIRDHSADVESYISEAIKQVEQQRSDNVKLLLGSDLSPRNRAAVVELLLSAAHIPVEQVYTLRLAELQEQQPELWLRSFNGKSWLYFDPVTGLQGLPEDRLIWWRGPQDLLSVEGGRGARTNISVHRSEMSALQLAEALQMRGVSSFMDFSLYELPLPSQQLYRILLMIPVGVLLVLLIRSLIGMETLGTFTPVLIALAFQETQVLWGVIMFTVITAMGLTLRSYLEHLRLQLLSRLSVVLTFVVILIALISLVSYKLGLSTGLSVALFPMVILTMVIERTSIVWEERGAGHSLKVWAGTMVAAVLCHTLMAQPKLIYFVFTFPGVLLCIAAAMVLMGHYRGYRLTELVRFRAMVER